MVFDLYHLSKERLKYVRAPLIVTKTEILQVFSRPKPDILKPRNTLDNNKQKIIPPKNVNITYFKSNVLLTACQSKILLLLLLQ